MSKLTETNDLLVFYSLKWVIPEKNQHTPDGWGRFFNPPVSPGFPEAQDPLPVWISKTKDPSSHLDFQQKILGLNLIYFNRKYTQSRLEDVLFNF